MIVINIVNDALSRLGSFNSHVFSLSPFVDANNVGLNSQPPTRIMQKPASSYQCQNNGLIRLMLVKLTKLIIIIWQIKLVDRPTNYQMLEM